MSNNEHDEETSFHGWDPVNDPRTDFLVKLNLVTGKSATIPAENSYLLPDDINIGPMTLFKDGTEFHIFSDGRWFTVTKGLNSSHHAQWNMSGFVYFRYNTSGHTVDELKTVNVISDTVSHDRHSYRKYYTSEKRGWHTPIKDYWGLLNREDIDLYFHATGRRVSLIVPNYPDLLLEPDFFE